MNWLEKHRKKIEDMKMSETIVKVPKAESKILKSKFSGNKDVKEIRLPQTILYIEKAAFRDCISLEKINLPPNVCYILPIALKRYHRSVVSGTIIALRAVPPVSL